MLSQLGDYFRKQPVKRAFLFGSAARGDYRPDSDVDILVELDYEQGANFDLFMDMKDQLSTLLNRPVDLVSANGLSPFIKPYIDNDKQLIYEKAA